MTRTILHDHKGLLTLVAVQISPVFPPRASVLLHDAMHSLLATTVSDASHQTCLGAKMGGIPRVIITQSVLRGQSHRSQKMGNLI